MMGLTVPLQNPDNAGRVTRTSSCVTASFTAITSHPGAWMVREVIHTRNLSGSTEAGFADVV